MINHIHIVEHRGDAKPSEVGSRRSIIDNFNIYSRHNKPRNIRNLNTVEFKTIFTDDCNTHTSLDGDTMVSSQLEEFFKDFVESRPTGMVYNSDLVYSSDVIPIFLHNSGSGTSPNFFLVPSHTEDHCILSTLEASSWITPSSWTFISTVLATCWSS